MPLIVAIGYNLIFGTLVAYYLYHAGLKRVSGEQVSVLFYIDPMVGVIGSVLILGEQFTMTTLAGVLLVIGGLYFSELRSHRIHGHFSHHR
jgi:drug/metabolite transporter (DMT)-like permease